MGSVPNNRETPRGEADVLTPLAIIGMSFRFPQDAVDAASFWDMLLEERCASTEVPADRFNIAAHHHPDKEQLESSTVRNGHFLTGDIGAWDAPFFNITASEAEAMDPGQRLTLEAAFRALENAGLSLDAVAGTKTSVYSATFMHDYDTIQLNDPDVHTKYKGTGTSANMLSNRVSWFFDMMGPSGSVDTACSSSLLALDLVCQSIWSGDATMGLACGNNIMLTPHTFITLDNLGLLGKDGRCFSFDHRANGYARGEGVGVIVVKPLSSALRDGDTIRAVIRSSCSNQDGHTPAISQPSREAQERLILHAHEKAGLGLGTTRYFEAHGTGTPVGDPIETGSIGQAYRQYRSPAGPLYIGSVKSNIGHLEGAAGVAGVIKAVLALEAGVIPPQTNFEKLNSAIDTEFLNIRIPTEATPWPTTGLRRASIQSFGIGGANSHVILDDACNFLGERGLRGHHNTVPLPPSKGQRLGEVLLEGLPLMNGFHNTNGNHTNGDHTNGDQTNGDYTNGVEHTRELEAEVEKKMQLMVWSTHDEAGIKRLIEQWKTYLSNLTISTSQTPQFISNMAYTLAMRRTHFSNRTFAVLKSPEDLAGLGNEMAPAIRVGVTPKLGFIFTGQGSQWYAMGRGLCHRFPVYRNSLVQASVYLQGLGSPWDAVEELMRDEPNSNINDAEYSQPLCTILQIALVDLLESFGILPCKVVGHSSGEIAAAYCAGALSRQTAWKVAYLRGHLASQLTNPESGKHSKITGAMMAVGLSAADVQPYLDQVAKNLGSTRLVIACVNSPLNVTISGEESHINHLKGFMDASPANIFARKLKVKLAYHSFQMLEVANEYITRLGKLPPPPIPASIRHSQAPVMVSSVTGTWTDRNELAKPEYWAKNLVSPVLFAPALETLCTWPDSHRKSVTKKLDGSHAKVMPITEIVEIGPHAVMKGPTREILRPIGKEKSISYMSALLRNESATATVLNLAGRLHCLGHHVRLERVNAVEVSSEKSKLSNKVLATLPEYPFNHSKSYWTESRLSKVYRFRQVARHDLLGAPAFDWNPLDARWRHFMRTSSLPWTEHHKINGTTLYPAAGMLVMAIEAARQLADPGRELSGFLLHDVSFHSALEIPNGSKGVEVNLNVRPRRESGEKDAGWLDFRLYRHEPSTISDWNENCSGSVQVVYKDNPSSDQDEMGISHENEAWINARLGRVRQFKAECVETAEPKELYQKLDESGYQYGPAFQGITELRHDRADAAIATVQTYKWARHFEGADPGSAHIVHPTTLDTIMHTMLAVLTGGGTKTIATTIPTFAERIWVSASGGLSSPGADSVTVFTNSGKSGLRGSHSSLLVTDPSCQAVLMDVENLQTTAVASADTEDTGIDRALLKPGYTVDWRPDLTLLSLEQIGEFVKGQVAVAQSEFTPKDWQNVIDQFILSTIARTMETVRAGGQPIGHHTRYVEWMQAQMDEFQKQGSYEPMPDAVYEETARALAEGDEQAQVFAAIARDHVSLLTGDEKPSSGAMPVKSEQCDQATLSTAINALVDAMSHKYPDMHILELGSSSNLDSMSEQILKTLTTREKGSETSLTPRFSRYDYTSSVFESLSAAKERLGSFGERIYFSALDVSKDVQAQNFNSEKYDFIIGSSGDMGTASLSNVGKLLRPGGLFVNVPATLPDDSLRTTFVFGLNEEWWSGPGSSLPQDGWEEAYQKAGFTDHCIVELGLNSSLLICRNPASNLEGGPPKADGFALFIIYDDNDSEQQRLAVQLGEQCKDADFSSVQPLTLSSAASMPVSDDTMLVFLLDLEAPAFSNIESNLFGQLQRLLTENMNAKILWLSRDYGPESAHQLHDPDSDQPAYRLIDGLSRVLNSEVDGEVLHVLSLEHRGAVTSHQVALIVSAIGRIHRPIDAFPDTEWRETNGLPCVPRMVQSAVLNQQVSSRLIPRHEVQRPWCDNSQPDGGEPLKLVLGTPGLLNTLHFVEDEERSKDELPEDHVEIKIEAVGLNYRDVLIALGRLQNAQVGCECAGIITAVGSETYGLKVGDRVAALCADGCYRSYLRVDHRFAARIPDSTPFTEAAAMVVNHFTAWSTIHDLGRLTPDETVLVHSAAGGTGQAAVQVAQYIGAHVLATTGTARKKAFLTETYGINPEHIFSSRDANAFSRGVKRITEDRGVDVILNALSGESLLASWECLAPFGRFMEIGKRDIHARKGLPMAQFDQGVSFQGFDIGVVCKSRPAAVRPMLEKLFSLHEKGILKPASPLQVFGVSELEKVFRTMQRGETIGKIVIEMRAEDTVKAVLDRKPSTVIPADATYLIAGGLGGLGRCMAGWLVDRGARNLILLGRTGVRSQEARDFVYDLEAKGITVATPPCDITDAVALKTVINQCTESMPPIRGAIQATMVLRDAVFMGMTHDLWTQATAPKVQGSWNMHTLLPADMDFFIGLSSVAGVAGGRGQANYAAGNTYIDALMEHRVQRGQRGVALDLGVFMNVGFILESSDLMARWGSKGDVTLREEDLFALLDIYCSGSKAPTQAILGISGFLGDKSSTYFLRKPMLRTLALETENADGAVLEDAQSKQSFDMGAIFSKATSLDEASAAVNEALLRKLSATLSLSREELDADTPLHTYGVDSLVAVELRNWFIKEVHADLAIFDILGSATTRTASRLAAVKTRYKAGGWDEGENKWVKKA